MNKHGVGFSPSLEDHHKFLNLYYYTPTVLPIMFIWIFIITIFVVALCIMIPIIDKNTKQVKCKSNRRTKKKKQSLKCNTVYIGTGSIKYNKNI